MVIGVAFFGRESDPTRITLSDQFFRVSCMCYVLSPPRLRGAGALRSLRSLRSPAPLLSCVVMVDRLFRVAAQPLSAFQGRSFHTSIPTQQWSRGYRPSTPSSPNVAFLHYAPEGLCWAAAGSCGSQ